MEVETSHPLIDLNPRRGTKKRTLGEGTYGVVELYEIDGKEYAVKLTRSGQITSTVLREAAVMRRLDHPNVCPLLDVGTTPKGDDYQNVDIRNMKIALRRRGLSDYGTRVELDERLRASDLAQSKLVFYMTLPLATGGTLRSHLKEEGLTDEQRVRYSFQLLLGMDYLLSRNILHRDLKPENLLLTWDDQLQIADFGLARALSCVEGTGLSREVQTLWYRAPEILLGGTYGSGADQWSVGCILYEIFKRSTRVLFPGDNEIDQLYKIFRVLGTPTKEIYGSYPEWQETFPQWKPDLHFTLSTAQQALVMRLLRYEPHTRASYRELLRSPYFDSVRPGPLTNPSYDCLDNVALRTEIPDPLHKDGVGDAALINQQIWILEACRHFDQTIRTTIYATNLLRKVWKAAVGEPGNEFKLGNFTFLTGMVPPACVYLASAYHEIYGLTTYEDLVVWVKNPLLTKIKLKGMCLAILQTLEFDLLWATCQDYYAEYLRFYPAEVMYGGNRLMQCMTIMEMYHRLPPKQVAMVCLLGGCVGKKVAFKHPLIELIAPYNELLEELSIDKDGNMSTIMELADRPLKDELIKLREPILKA